MNKRNNMRKMIVSSLLLSLCLLGVKAQTQNDEVFKQIADKNYYSFTAINGKIVGYGQNATKIYDKSWNLLEQHDAGQSELQTGMTSASRSFEYVTSSQSYKTTSWTTNQNYYTTNKYGYTILNFTPFYAGEADIIYFIKAVGNVYLNTHSVSFFGSNLSGIAGQASSVMNSYTRLVTDFQIVDWDGNIISKTALPYYSNGYSFSYLEVEDKGYIIVTALSDIYSKTAVKDVDLYSTTPYDIASKAYEPGYSHYFIYEFDKLSKALTYVRMEKGPATNVVEIARFDLNGERLHAPQRGVNIVVFSDGTSRKVTVR